MAQHIVTILNSPGTGFTDPAAQSLLVVTSGAVMTGSAVMSGGFSTVSVSGTVDAIGTDAITLGTFVLGGPDTGGNNTVVVTSDGTISGGQQSAIVAYGSANTILNDGVVGPVIVRGTLNTVTNNGIMGSVSTFGDEGNSGGKITNAGTIDAGLAAAAVGLQSSYVVQNTGTISGGTFSVQFNGSGNKLESSGSLSAAVLFNNASGANLVVNSGDISSGLGTIAGWSSFALVASAGAAGDETIDNSGRIQGRIALANGTNTLNNTGTIVGDFEGGTGTDSVANGGYLNGSLFMFDGANALRNSGTVTGNYNGGLDGDLVSNTGVIRGSVITGDGADTVLNRLGTILGTIDLGAGDDTATGGDNAETFAGGLGLDTLAGNGGNDRFLAGVIDGDDSIDGGDGIDTYDSSLLNVSTLIDLEDGFATGLAPGFDLDVLFSIENATGSDGGNDTIIGTDGANVLSGLAGVDLLTGLGGIDTLRGGLGADRLIGGAGRDYLFGGGTDGAADIFDFDAIAESGLVSGVRDIIMDFEDGFDRIDLSTIDAKSHVAGNQAFQLIAGNFTAAGGQVKVIQLDNGNSRILINSDADIAAEMTIGVKGAPTLTAIDFIL